VEKHGKDFDRNPVGSGPYTFVEWASKSHVTVKRNPDYNWGSTMFKHQGTGYPDQFTIRLIADPNTRMATLETGEIHVGEQIPPEEVERLKAIPKLQMLSQPAYGTGWALQMNTTSPPLDDVKVRMALNHAVNQEEIVKVLFKGALPAAHSPWVKGTLGYDESHTKVYSFDPAKGKALLEEAGWNVGSDGIREKDGKKLNTSINIISASIQALPIKMAEVVQAQLREIGVFMEIRQTDTAALFALMNEGTQSIIFGRRAGVDPDVARPLFHSSFFGKSPVARIRFKDDTLDKLLMDGSQELDRTKRQGIYKQVGDIIMKNALVVPLWEHTDFVGAQASVKGLSMDPHGYVNLYDAWIAKS
jgi:peptide/nickel transport system substrate-binding protein